MQKIHSALILVVLLLVGCTVELKVKDIDKLDHIVDRLLDGGITINIGGIPDGGVPVRFLTELPTGTASDTPYVEDDSGQ
jgi:hypothetical protein